MITPILDVCCGSKMFYFDKNNPKVTFMDCRELDDVLCDGRRLEIKPDIIVAALVGLGVFIFMLWMICMAQDKD